LTTDQARAVEVAREYVAKNLPQETHVLKYRSAVFDRGDTWGVTFVPPGEAVTGGVPEVYVDKKSHAVSRVERAM
jgi:hypothetical protein